MPTTDFDVQLNLYSILRCGLYDETKRYPADKYAPPKVLAQYELLKDIKAWAIDSQRDFVRTTPVGLNPKLYCYGVTEHDGTILLALWNELPISKGGIAYLPKNGPAQGSVPGTAKVGPGDIPGYMSYFIFVPALNRFAPVQVRAKGGTKPPISTPAMSKFLECFVMHHCEYRMPRVNNEIRFSDKPKSTSAQIADLNLAPKIKWRRSISSPEIQKVKQRAGDIVKVIYKIRNPDKVTTPANNLLNRLVQAVDQAQQSSNEVDDSKDTVIKLPVKGLLASEVAELESDFLNFGGMNNFNAGFVLKDDRREYWLDKTYRLDSDTLQVQTDKANREFPLMLELHKQIVKRFGVFLKTP
jgi:hypothetical protein